MRNSTDVISTETDWDEKLMWHELEALRREQLHLSSKSYERPLTGWEESRLGEVLSEFVSLLGRLLDNQPRKCTIQL